MKACTAKPDDDAKPMNDAEIASRVREVSALSSSGLRLMMGELSAQEIRSIRAVLNYIQSSANNERF